MWVCSKTRKVQQASVDERTGKGFQADQLSPTKPRHSPFIACQIEKILTERRNNQLEAQAATAKELANLNQHLLRRLNEQQNQEAQGEFFIQRRIDERTEALQAAHKEMAEIFAEHGPSAWALLPPSLKVPEVFQNLPEPGIVAGSQTLKAEAADFVLQEILDDLWWACAELGYVKLPQADARDRGVAESGAVAAVQRLVVEIQEMSISCARDEAILHDQVQALPELHRVLRSAPQKIEDLTVRQSKQDGMNFCMLDLFFQKLRVLQENWDAQDEEEDKKRTDEFRRHNVVSEKSQARAARAEARKEVIQEALHDVKRRRASDPQHKNGAWSRLWLFLKRETETSRKELEHLRVALARTKLVEGSLSKNVDGLHRQCEALRAEIRDQSLRGSRELQRMAVWAGKVETCIVHTIAALEVRTESDDPAALAKLRNEVDSLRSIKPPCFLEQLMSEWEALLAFVERDMGVDQVDHQMASEGPHNDEAPVIEEEVVNKYNLLTLASG